ncbi:MAG: GTP-binding protein [Chloroflexi bacterium]|nr:GTP-binding protein [Chloroflexota bacterium]
MKPTSQLAIKVVVAGDGNVGKTSLIRQYCEGKFESSRVMTIGVDFQTKRVALPEGEVKLSIWDMAGQERFAVMRSGFYRGSRAAALVFDVTQAASLTNLETWRAEILKVMPDQKFVVVGNKIDLPRDEATQDAANFAAQIGAEYVETSAATGDGVPKLFEALARLAIG